MQRRSYSLLIVSVAWLSSKLSSLRKTTMHTKNATYGLVFFAVPHRGGYGANAALGAVAKNIVVSMTGDSRNDLVESLRQNSSFLENQANLFRHQLEDYRIVSIFEDRMTKLVKFFGRAISSVSEGMQIPLLCVQSMTISRK